MAYELWDSESGNRVGVYRSERAALDDVADAVRRYGSRSREVLSLGLLGPRRRLLADGADLVERALAASRKRSVA